MTGAPLAHGIAPASMGCAASAPKVSGDAKRASVVREPGSSGEPARPPVSPDAAAPSDGPSLYGHGNHPAPSSAAIASPVNSRTDVRAGDMKGKPDTNGHASARSSLTPTAKSSMTPGIHRRFTSRGQSSQVAGRCCAPTTCAQAAAQADHVTGIWLLRGREAPGSWPVS